MQEQLLDVSLSREDEWELLQYALSGDDLIELERRIYSYNQFIKTGKVLHEEFYSALLPRRIVDVSPDNVIISRLIISLDEANELIRLVDLYWDIIKHREDRMIKYKSYYYNKLQINLEMIMHIICKFIDGIITYLMNRLVSEEDSKRVSSIEAYLKYDIVELRFLQKYKNFFSILYLIDKTNKSNSIDNYAEVSAARNEVCFFAIQKNKAGVTLNWYSLYSIVNQFNAFYKDLLYCIDNYVGNRPK